MTQARSTLVSPTDTPYYHCVSRCVRRAFLCGYDSHSQTDYEHRRQWLETKLHNVAEIFAIKLCAYAIMSNHYHVVVHICPTDALEWSQHEVVRRWHSLFKGTYLSQCFASGHSLLQSQKEMLDKDIEIWRERLSSLSWFMKVVNESIARRANKEDKCTGHFWESRFKSQALLDERALLSCMAYVDLNPIRAKMATSPETSDHTAIKTRIETLRNHKKTKTITREIRRFESRENRLTLCITRLPWTGWLDGANSTWRQAWKNQCSTTAHSREISPWSRLMAYAHHWIRTKIRTMGWVRTHRKTNVFRQTLPTYSFFK